MSSPVLDAIYKRRSIREFTDEAVADRDLSEIIKAGIWAPSGLNNQPWRFVTVKDRIKREELAELTKYSHIVRAAPALIAVYLEKSAMYNEVKDHQAAGACIQNILLATEALGLGGVWLGQILLNKDQVNNTLELSKEFDLMAIVAIGHPAHFEQKSERKSIDTFLLNKF